MPASTKIVSLPAHISLALLSSSLHFPLLYHIQMTSRSAKARQIITIVCLACCFLLSVIIMGLVGVNGRITLRSFHSACLLYISIDNDVVSYNNGYCLFPIIACAVTAVFALIFLALWIMHVHRKDEYAPKGISILFLALSGALAMLSFAVCGEIGIGLNKGCQILGDNSHNCLTTKNFNAIYGAEISAGIMGGLWLVAMLMELFQLKSKPPRLSSNIDYVSQTTVVPHRAAGSKTSITDNDTTIRDSGHGYYDNNNSHHQNNNTAAATAATGVGAGAATTATTTTHVQKQEYDAQAHGGHFPSSHEQHHQTYTTAPTTHTTQVQGNGHPDDANGVAYSTF
ncbi:hypothetical protein KVV02_006220 [Mortierella alpina]|uniref:Uncharacterized protein n=1 Tax=Mortierella alpina TaxID=64518 RepID=A0A9P8CZL2_MORAP|nr:hypothetical protein KVV02_006220 [Mortierella alpina]